MTFERLVQRHLLTPYLVEGVQYHSPLPPRVAEWHYYSAEVGHSVLCLLKAEYAPGLRTLEYIGWLVQIPVKSVLRGYEIQGGFVVVDVPYDYNTGVLLVPHYDLEFDDPPRRWREWSICP
jgi:hypothetical protein